MENTHSDPALGWDSHYRKWIGFYQFDSSRHLLFTREGMGAEATYFYAEGNHLVPLEPQSLTDWVSARGEQIILPEIVSDGPVILMDVKGQRQIGHRIHPYLEEEIMVTVNDYNLSGTLLLPSNPGPHPAVVVCHLANVHERDYYRLYAHHFVQHGCAALIFDKRGSGSSTGRRLSSEIYELADDAEAVFVLLQNDLRIAPRRVGLWGMSNGGWVDLLVASRHPDTAFIINLSASGVPPRRQEKIRRLNVSRVAGATSAQLLFLETFWDLWFAFVIEGEWSGALEGALQRLQQGSEWQPLLEQTGGEWLLEMPIEQLRQENAGRWADGNFDPIPLLEQLHCPILWGWGEADTILPVEESIAAVREALGETSVNWTIKTFPNASHLLYVPSLERSAYTSDVDKPGQSVIEFPAGLFELLPTWITSHLPPV